MANQERGAAIGTENRIAYKVLTADEASRMRHEGRFHGSPVDLADGFIHMSTASQLPVTIKRHFAGQAGLMIAAVDLYGWATRCAGSRHAAASSSRISTASCRSRPWWHGVRSRGPGRGAETTRLTVLGRKGPQEMPSSASGLWRSTKCRVSCRIASRNLIILRRIASGTRLKRSFHSKHTERDAEDDDVFLRRTSSCRYRSACRLLLQRAQPGPVAWG